MKLFSRIRKLLPKRLAVIVATALAALALPVASLQAADVRLEGSLGVANVTAGDTQYKESVNATYDQVVKVQVYYHNREDENSGKVANDLKIKLNVPTTAGKQQVISGSISSPDANTVQDSVTVNLDREDAALEYIPGSAVWKHNKGTNDNVQIVEEKLSDAIVTSGEGLVIEDAKPCFNFDATVTILIRVRVPSVSVSKKVRKAGTQDQTTTNLAVMPGQRLEYVVSAKNIGNKDLTNVYLRDPLPQGLTFVPGTAKKTYGSFVNVAMTASEANAFFTGKKNVGTLKPGASAFIVFEATVANVGQLKCGQNLMKNIVVVDTDQTGEYNNSATVTTNKDCENPTPSYSCDAFKVTVGENRTVTISEFKQTATNGATFKDVVVNWGDNTTPLTTNVPVGKSHTYAKDAEYTINATARFTVNGATVEAPVGVCTQKVNFTTPTTPGKLPETGAGEVVGIFAAVTVAGAIAHRVVLSRRYL